MPQAPAHMRAAIPSEEESAPLGPVLMKLLGFSIAMVVLPIGSYYLTRDLYFGEKNTTPPALIAATMANVVLGVFVYLAIRDDLNTPTAKELKAAEKGSEVSKEEKKKQ